MTEYYLQIWGSLNNDPVPEAFKGIGGDHWFPSPEERQAFVERLIKLAKDNGRCVTWREEEGDLVRKQTVATMTVVTPDGRRLPYEYNFGYGYRADSARYMFEYGSYSCDCNLSRFLGLPGMECGEKLKREDFKIEYR